MSDTKTKLAGLIHPNWRKQEFRDKAFWVVILILIFGMFWGGVIGRNYFIGTSKYESSCIDGGRVMIVDKSQPGTFATIEKGKIAAFHSDELNTKLGRKVIGAKYVAGVAGDHIVVKNGDISINGKHWGHLDLIDDGVLKGVSYSDYDADYVIPGGHVLMLGTTRSTYDGRYWGTVPEKHVVGRAYVVF